MPSWFEPVISDSVSTPWGMQMNIIISIIQLLSQLVIQLTLYPKINRWDYANPGYLDALKHITDLKEEGKTLNSKFKPDSGSYHLCSHAFPVWMDSYITRFCSENSKGKIKTVALTNFDTDRLQIILENGIPVVSNQVYFSTSIWRISFHLLLYGPQICERWLRLSGSTFHRWYAPSAKNGRALPVNWS